MRWTRSCCTCRSCPSPACIALAGWLGWLASPGLSGCGCAAYPTVLLPTGKPCAAPTPNPALPPLCSPHLAAPRRHVRPLLPPALPLLPPLHRSPCRACSSHFIAMFQHCCAHGHAPCLDRHFKTQNKTVLPKLKLAASADVQELLQHPAQPPRGMLQQRHATR